MRKSRQSLGWIFAILVILLAILLAYSMADASAINIGEHPGEHCYEWWTDGDSIYCDGGKYTLNFCYLPEDRFNNDFWRFYATCDSNIVPPIISISKIFLPIIYNTKPYDSTYLKCAYNIDDAWGITAGTVTSWFLVEYHPDGPIRLKPFFDKYEPDPAYQMVYHKWNGTPTNSLFDVNHLRTYTPDINWNSTYAESISVWKAVTYIGANKTYTLNSIAFRKGHYRYPIDCIKVPLSQSVTS